MSSFVYIGPTYLFIDAWCQQDEHVKAWRWYVFTSKCNPDETMRRLMKAFMEPVEL